MQWDTGDRPTPVALFCGISLELAWLYQELKLLMNFKL